MADHDLHRHYYFRGITDGHPVLVIGWTWSRLQCFMDFSLVSPSKQMTINSSTRMLIPSTPRIEGLCLVGCEYINHLACDLARSWKEMMPIRLVPSVATNAHNGFTLMNYTMGRGMNSQCLRISERSLGDFSDAVWTDPAVSPTRSTSRVQPTGIQ